MKVTVFVHLVLIVLVISTEEDHPKHWRNYGRSNYPTRGLKLYGDSVKLKSGCNGKNSCSLPWQCCQEGSCKCGELYYPISLVRCEIGKNLSVLNSYCTYYNQTSFSTFIGRCNYYNISLGRSFPTYYQDELFCNKYFSRTGILCSSCKADHFPLAFSFDLTCVKCSDGKSHWWKYLVLVFLPLTLFYFIVVLFQINIASSQLHGFVVFCQGIATPVLARFILVDLLNTRKLQLIVRIMGSFFTIWNLDIFRTFSLNVCLKTSMLQTIALDLAVGVYPLLLLMLSYLLIKLHDSNFKPIVLLWKPFKKCLGFFHQNWDIRTSIIDAFATFFYLSYMKFLTASFDFLAPVAVYEFNCTEQLYPSWRLYYNATLPYFGETHYPYAVLAIVILALFVLLPTLLLVLYPFHWFQRLLNIFHLRWYILHTFMDAFQGCFKDGTQPGTRDCRWFASFHFALRCLIMIVGMLTLTSMYFAFAAILLTLGAILFITAQPYKSNLAIYSDVNAIFMLLLALLYMAMFGYTNYSASNFLSLLLVFIMIATGVTSLLYISVIVVKWMFNRTKAWNLFSQ